MRHSPSHTLLLSIHCPLHGCPRDCVSQAGTLELVRRSTTVGTLQCASSGASEAPQQLHGRGMSAHEAMNHTHQHERRARNASGFHHSLLQQGTRADTVRGAAHRHRRVHPRHHGQHSRRRRRDEALPHREPQPSAAHAKPRTPSHVAPRTTTLEHPHGS